MHRITGVHRTENDAYGPNSQRSGPARFLRRAGDAVDQPHVSPAMGISGLVAALAATVLALPDPSMAGDITFDGNVRVRTELDGRSFDPDVTTRETTDLRVRLGAKANLADNGVAYVQFQDSRRFGGSIGGVATSGSLHHGANVDVHQAYLRLDDFLDESWGLQAGRFELNLGNERVFGAVGWNNVGRSWEGFDTWYELGKARIDGLWLKAIERNDAEANRDFDVFALYATLPDPGVQLGLFFENDAKVASEASPIGSLERYDLVAYAKRTYPNFDLETNLVYQLGTQERLGAGSEALQADIGAYLITAELGVPVGARARLAAGIDLASGDDDPGDDELQSYDNLYYTGHKFRGFMDYFVGSPSRGLLDAMLRGSFQPAEGWTLKGDVHLFQTAVDYTDFEGEETKDVGIEVDLQAVTTRVRGAQVELGASAFLPSESFAGMADPDPGLWFYTALTAGF